MVELTLPYVFLLGMLAGAGLVGAGIGWYLNGRRKE
jgi:hypothetical protein